MALAWKAGWVHALTSSNLVSSATSIPALTRAGIFLSGIDGALLHDSCPECAPSFRGVFSSEHLSAPHAVVPYPVDVGSRRLADAGMCAAHHEVRGAGEVDQWLLPGALIARTVPSLSEVIPRGDGPEQLVEIFDADPDEPHAEP